MKLEKIALHTTFDLLRANDACEDGYKEFAKHLGGVRKYGRATPINLLTVLESNGVRDMLWCIRATSEPFDDFKNTLTLIAADIAEMALPIFEKRYPDDKRPRDALEAARAYARGEISTPALAKARRAATACVASITDAAADAAAACVAYAACAADAADAAACVASITGAAADAAAARSATYEELAAIIRNYLSEDA